MSQHERQSDGAPTEVTALYPWIQRIDHTLMAIRFYAGAIIVLLALILWRLW